MSVQDNKIEIEMNRGFLQILVLLTLETPMYGYMMLSFIEGKGYTVEENTLYPMLRRLEKNGWLTSSWDVEHNRPKKYYTITEEGRKFREKLLNIRQLQTEVLTEISREVKNG
jgi:PadR family transcriptional regulator